MNIIEGLRIALTALAANRIRSILTTLGVIIGVSAVIAMVALGEGARRDVEERIKKMGTNLLMVAPGKADRGRIFRGFGSAQTLTVDEARDMPLEVPEVAGTAPEKSRNVQVKRGSSNNNVRVIGTFSSYSFVRNVELAQGRFFNRLEEEGRRRVAVVGAQIAEDMYEGQFPLGKRLKLSGIPFTIVGVLTSKGGMGREDETVYIPLSTFRQRFSGDEYVNMIAVAGKDGVEPAKLEAAVRKYLRRRHNLRLGEEDNFSMAGQEDLLSTMTETTRVFTLLLGGIASISLVVGGIGIMNIMLVTVTERTREIGIRKALGARRRDIEIQFLIESIVLSVLGGLLGIALGIFIAWFVRTKIGLSTYVAPESVVLAFGCAAGIGIFFGYYPASQAGKLDPIQALRYE